METDREILQALLILERGKIDKITDALGIVKAISKRCGLITNDEAQAKIFEELTSEEGEINI